MAKLLVDENTQRKAAETQFEMESWIDGAPFEDLLGMTIEQAAEGRAVLSLPFTVKLAQGGGLMHGGALTSLADTAVAMAIKTLLSEGARFATTELSMRFLSPVKGGRVTAEARVRGPEGRSFYGEAVLTDDKGVEVARFCSTFRVARGQGFED